MITRYVLGFAFNVARTHVLLTRKTHPDWQAGKLNGIGGHLEATDFGPADDDANMLVRAANRAMFREGVEEARLEAARWELFAHMANEQHPKKPWECFCYRAFDPSLGHAAAWRGLQNDAGEDLVLQPILGVFTENAGVIPNLRFLIPLALQKELDARYPIELRYIP